MAFDSNAFGHRLMVIRNDRKMSQRDLAAATGIGYSAIARYEKGSVIPQVDTLCVIADALNCTTDQLVGREAFVVA